jgi:hypothetical protein
MNPILGCVDPTTTKRPLLLLFHAVMGLFGLHATVVIVRFQSRFNRGFEDFLFLLGFLHFVVCTRNLLRSLAIVCGKQRIGQTVAMTYLRATTTKTKTTATEPRF